jgi:hypothetical protein
MEGFRKAVDYCGFRDLGFSDQPYTWDNRREGMANIKVRLDRALVNMAWLDLFHDTVVLHLQMAQSDHCGLLIHTCAEEATLRRGSRRRPFKYENMWRRHESYFSTVSTAWSTGCTNLSDVVSNLGNVQHRLSMWDQEEFGSVRKELHHLNTCLEEERSRNMHSGPLHEERRLMSRLGEVLAREEIMEKQRSRVDWLHAGDRNTGFFM